MIDPILGTVEYALGGLQMRTDAIADNMANANTPLYQAKRVSFESNLATAIRDGQPVPADAPVVTGGLAIPDSQGNNVHLETEMTEMSKTALARQTLIQGFNYKVGLYKIATHEVSGAFSSLDIALTGMGFAHYWQETVSHNIANINTVSTFDKPFRARMVVAQPIDPSAASGGGVAVAQVYNQAGDPAMLFQPDSPLANADGYVAGPVVDLAGQMSDLILSSRMYQANITVHKEAREALEAATTLGK